MTRTRGYAVVPRLSRVYPASGCLFLLLPALVVAASSSRCQRRKAGEGLGDSRRIDFGQPVGCLGAGVGVKRVIGNDVAQGLGAPGWIDFGQSQRRLKAVVGVVLVHSCAGFLCKISSGIRAGQPGCSGPGRAVEWDTHLGAGGRFIVLSRLHESSLAARASLQPLGKPPI